LKFKKNKNCNENSNQISKKNIITKMFDQKSFTNYEKYNKFNDDKITYLDSNEEKDYINQYTSVYFNRTNNEKSLDIIDDNNNNTSNVNFNIESKLRHEKIKIYLEKKKEIKSKNIKNENYIKGNNFNENTINSHELIKNSESNINNEFDNDKYKDSNKKIYFNTKKFEKNIFEELNENIYFNKSENNNYFIKGENTMQFQEKSIKMKKLNFKNLQTFPHKKNLKKQPFGVTNSSYSSSFYNFNPQLTHKQSINNKMIDKNKIPYLDPYLTINSSNRSSSNRKNLNKEINFSNFFLSPKTSNKIISSLNFSNKMINNNQIKNENNIQIKNENNNLIKSEINPKNKEIGKIKFSYFSEFASLKKVDSLKMRSNYNSIEPIKIEFESNINKNINIKKNINMLMKNEINFNCSRTNNYFNSHKFNSIQNESSYPNYNNFHKKNFNTRSPNMKSENLTYTNNFSFKKKEDSNNINSNNKKNQNFINFKDDLNGVSDYEFISNNSTKNKNIKKTNLFYNNIINIDVNNGNLPKLNTSNKNSYEKFDNYQKYQEAFIQNLRNYENKIFTNTNNDNINTNLNNKFNKVNYLIEKNKNMNFDNNLENIQINKINFDNFVNIHNENLNSINCDKDDKKKSNPSKLPNNYLLKRVLNNNDFSNKNLLDSSGYGITKIKKLMKLKIN